MAVTTLISPGVEVKEIDKTASLGAVALGGGAFAGAFQWGPANQIVVINSEADLVKTFGKPDTGNTVASNKFNWLTAASFLGYTSGLQVVRTLGANSANSRIAVTGTIDGATWFNLDDYDSNPYAGDATEQAAFIARYPGTYGDNLGVAIVDNAKFSGWTWEKAFPSAPGSSANYTNATNNDCIHVVVYDAGGGITGVVNTILEKFTSVSILADAKTDFGNSNYIKDRIRDEGQWIFFGGFNIPAETGITDEAIIQGWAADTSLTAAIDVLTTADAQWTFTGGANGDDSNLAAARGTGYDLFADPDTTDVSFFVSGSSETTSNVNAKLNTITSARKDAFAFISPPVGSLTSASATLATKATEVETWANSATLPKSSYIVADSGYKKMYNKYNDEYVAVPLNGDIAGISALTRINQDAWWSPAGFTRGQVRNAASLYFNPGQEERDKLYPVGVNPVVSMPGRGTLLYGDKTTQLGTGAFTRINVRGLFIVLESTISNFAKNLLFEFNDDFTRSQFRSLVGGYLESVQTGRGITDYRVICDETNNTGDVVDANEFVGDIFIKPTRSINFIRLNFIAVRTAVSFSEVGA
tara:strand:+ start:9902 stop:11659 length:1758 start_codon:yes stop_codon:yes gene_type:complete